MCNVGFYLSTTLHVLESLSVIKAVETEMLELYEYLCNTNISNRLQDEHSGFRHFCVSVLSKGSCECSCNIVYHLHDEHSCVG